MITKYVVFVKDKNGPAWVWASRGPLKRYEKTLVPGEKAIEVKKEEVSSMSFGPPMEPVWYDGWKIALFTEDRKLAAKVALRRKGRLERWDYDKGVRVSFRQERP